MLKPSDATRGIDLAIELTERERAVLASAVKQEWFDILQRIMEDQVRRFNLKLINTNPADKENVIANHYLAKSVAMFYVGLMDKISQECEVQTYNNAATNEPINEMNIEELR